MYNMCILAPCFFNEIFFINYSNNMFTEATVSLLSSEFVREFCSFARFTIFNRYMKNIFIIAFSLFLRFLIYFKSQSLQKHIGE